MIRDKKFYSIIFICFLLGFMISVQVRTAQENVKTSTQYQRIEKLSDMLLRTEQERDELKAEIVRLKEDGNLRKEFPERINFLAGTTAVKGPGVVVSIEDSKKIISNSDNTNLYIIHDEDILKVNIPEIMGDKPFKVVANLPYYITTPIIMALLEKHLPITDIVVMVQKEVAERMAAQPGGKTYGALSVAVQYYTVPEIALYVPPRSFMPPPEVDSVVVNCKVRQTPAVELIDEKMFFRVVKAAFGQRRKTLNNALKSMGVDKNIIADVLDKAGIEATRRGETLTMEEFGAIANILAQMAKQEA